MLDIALDAATHDILLYNNDIMYIDNAERVAQQIKIQLLTFYGEWFLDTTHGVPYLDYVLIKNPSLDLIREIFRQQILEVDGVQHVNSIELEYYPRERILLCDYSVDTVFGLLTKKEILGYEGYNA